MSTVSKSSATTGFHTALSRVTDTSYDHQHHDDEDRLHTPDDYQAMLERAMMMQKPFDEIPYDRSASSSRLSSSRLEAHAQQQQQQNGGPSNSQLRQSNGWMGARNVPLQAPSPAPYDRNAYSSTSATHRPISPTHSISSVATSRGPALGSTRSYSGSVSTSSNYSTSARNGYPNDSSDDHDNPSARNGRHNSSASSSYSYSHQSTHAPRSLTSHDTSHNIHDDAAALPHAHGTGPANPHYRAEAQAPVVVDNSGWETAFQTVSNQDRGGSSNGRSGSNGNSSSDFAARLANKGNGSARREMHARPASPSASSSADTSYEAASDAGTETGSTSTISRTSAGGGGKGIRARNREILRNGSGEGSGRSKGKAKGSGDPEMDELIQSIKKMEMKRNMLENAPKPPGLNGNAWRLKPESSSSTASTASPGIYRPPFRHAEAAPVVVGHLVSPDYLRQPSEDYMAIARRSSQSLHISNLYDKRPKLLVLDLNNTLLARKRATSTGARNAHMRPFLSSFLEYICGADEVDGKLYRRFNVMIWSSAQPDNVKAMVESMGLLKTVSGGQAPFLVDVWARDSMDLTEETYNAKFPTIKDLSKIWRVVTWTAPSKETQTEPVDLLGDLNPHTIESPIQHWSQYDTILIDDSAGKACLQPYNHLHIPSWKPFTPDQFRPNTSIKPGDDDNVLLQVIGMLDHLKLQSNISAAFRSGRYGGIGRTPVGHEWKRLGENVLERAGIQKSLNFDREWGDRILSGNDPSQALAVAQLYGMDTRNGAGRVGWN